jgi:diguanylate cyclase (GGDEF)-like protein
VLLAQDRTLAQQLSRAFILLGRLVAAAFLLTAVAYGVTGFWLTPEREQSQVAVKAANAAHTAMLDEEVGLRGYLLTHDVRFLQPYVDGEPALAHANDILTAYVGNVSGVPEVAVALFNMRLSEERWHERWAALAADTRPGAIAPSMSAGKALLDVYRGEQASFAAQLNTRSEVTAQREQRLVAARVALELLVFIAVLLLAIRQHSALRETIVTPVAALLRHIGGVRDGELKESVDPAGPRELRQLGEGLNEMVHALTSARESAASRDELVREHSARLRQILNASREFSESLNLTYVVGAVRESTATVGGYQRVVVWLMDDEQRRLVNAEATEVTGALDAAIELGYGLAGRAAKSGRITFEGHAGNVHFNDSNLGPVRAIAIPLIVGARVVGAVEARHADAREVTTQAVEVLEMLATHAATAIESARLHERSEERSQRDALTRLFNRRRLDEDLDAECKRSIRYGRPLTLVMLDVDHFKAFNDTHGHPQADSALQEVAIVIGSCVRTTDTAYRYGGEEFCILLRETTAEDAMPFAERVRRRIEQRFVSGPMVGITASFGVAGFLADAPTPRALVEAADVAMYLSKEGGRNRVVLSLRAALAASART